MPNLSYASKLFYVSLFFLVSTLTGCGFHLRGPVSLAPPLKKVYIQTHDPYGALTRNLEQSLAFSGAEITTTPAEANVILDIISEVSGEQLLSVGNTQQTRQYNLTLTAIFQLTTPKGKVLLSPQTINETQSVTINSDQILAGSNEKNNLYSQMRRNIIYNIMNRLSSKEVAVLVSQQ